MAKSVPARWLPYLAIGESIPGTRFISFKVPLKEEICKKLAPDERFTPCMLVEKLDRRLGLVIDLTNTNRYYNPEELKRMGVQHVKILCEGRKVPNTSVVAKFYSAVDDYLRENTDNEKLIGVHCTHGVNRTGYLVCRYMIDKLGFQPDAAINAFNKARRHDMERQHYLDGLRLSAGDDSTKAWSSERSRRQVAEPDGAGPRGIPMRLSRDPTESLQPYMPQRGATSRQQRRSHSDYRRGGDRPPPRPPARAGWHTPPSYKPRQSVGFGSNSGQESYYNDPVAKSYSDFYTDPNTGYQYYTDPNSGYQHYLGPNSGYPNYPIPSVNDGYYNYQSSNTSVTTGYDYGNNSYAGANSSYPGANNYSSQPSYSHDWRR